MRLIIALMIIMFSLQISQAQGWRGIKPLRSTCEDVKRALGVDKCEYPESVYRLQDQTVTVGFIMCPCPILCYHVGSGWNVPIGTVGGITRELRNKPLPISNFNVDSGKWKKTYTDFIGQVLYNNYDEGISLDTVNGQVFTIHYYPPLDKHKDLVCPPCSVPPPPNPDEPNPSVWVQAYDKAGSEQEDKLLDTFAEKLKAQGADFKGYIVAYDGCRERGVAALRAERAKKYLVESHGIDNSRIDVIDGGQHEELSIELQVRASNLPPPRTFSSTYPAERQRQKPRK